MKVIEIEGNVGVVEAGGVRRKILLDLVDDARVGDYVVVHAGYAIHTIDEKEARENIELFNQFLTAADIP